VDYLIDTSVISEVTKQAPNPHVVAFLHGKCFLLSCIVLDELIYGAHRLPDGHKDKQRYLRFIDCLAIKYRQAIVPVSSEIATISGKLRARQERSGRTLAGADALIAATAIHTGTTLVTRNVRDFAALQIPLLNPFDPATAP